MGSKRLALDFPDSFRSHRLKSGFQTFFLVERPRRNMDRSSRIAWKKRAPAELRNQIAEHLAVKVRDSCS